MLSAWAADSAAILSISRVSGRPAESMRTARREMVGNASLKSWRRLPCKSGGWKSSPGDVASGPRDAGDEPVADRLFHGRYDDWNSLRCLLSGQSCCGIRCDDDIDVETHGLGRKLREALRCAASPAPLDHDVPTIDVAEVAELLDEGIDVRGSRRRTRREHGDPRHLSRLLRQRAPRYVRDHQT